MEYDVDALISDPVDIVLVPGFAALFLLCRGAPALLLYRRDLPRSDLPSLVALVGAGMLSVLPYPILGLGLLRRRAE
jgi:hypothetical protein